MKWQPIKTAPKDEIVMTAIIDADGERNSQKLIFTLDESTK